MLQTETIVRRIFYVVLLALAPGFLFLIQVMLFVPPALMFSGIPSALWTQLEAGELGASAAILFLPIHFLVFAGLYWLVAFLLGKLVVFFRAPGTSRIVFISILIGIIAQSQLAVFGGGGHGPAQMGPIQTLFVEFDHQAAYKLYPYLGSVGFFAVVALVLSMRETSRAS